MGRPDGARTRARRLVPAGVAPAAFVMAFVLAAALVVPARPARAQESCADTLAAEAEEVLRLPATEDPDRLVRARQLVRLARALSGSDDLLFRALDLAVLAGDEAEATVLAREAAARIPQRLGRDEWLLVARDAEARNDPRTALLAYRRYALLARGVPASLEERMKRLVAEEEARKIAVPSFPPPTRAARRAFAEGKDALARGDRDGARRLLSHALALSPGYSAAALALGGLEAGAGRAQEAIAAYREALAAEPDRVEALLPLSSLLWEEPDRSLKEESLRLLEHALVVRPEPARPWLTAAERWAEWGDAARALDRLDAYRARVPARERRATDALAQRLRLRLSAGSAPPAPAEADSAPLDSASPALPSYRLAQVYLARGDVASEHDALAALSEAERLDPGFALAHDLSATILERRGDRPGAEAALRRSIAADPSRATPRERLARLLSEEPGRGAEAEAAWREAERTGSREALAVLARLADGRGDDAEARRLYARLLVEAPDSAGAEEAERYLSAWRRDRQRLAAVAATATLAAILVPLALVVPRRRGTTLSGWLGKAPADAVAVRPLVGRLRHETLKHGGLLLRDAARRLRDGDEAARRDAAGLLLHRLFGEAEGDGRPGGGTGAAGAPAAPAGTGGLVAESRRTLDSLVASARERGVTLNARYKDPVLAPLGAALRGLERVRGPLRALASDPERAGRRAVDAVVQALERAAQGMSPAAGAHLGRLLDEATATPVVPDEIARLLAAAASERGVPVPPFEVTAPDGLRVRVPRADLATVFRNLFANALDAARDARSGPPRLALLVEAARDPVTGQAVARLVLADDVPRPLTSEMIHGRAAERGLGVVADIVRAHEGLVTAGPPPASLRGMEKAVVLELPALEGTA